MNEESLLQEALSRPPQESLRGLLEGLAGSLSFDAQLLLFPDRHEDDGSGLPVAARGGHPRATSDSGLSPPRNAERRHGAKGPPAAA